MALKDDKEGMGVSWLWMLPDDHPFTPAAKWHDEQYDLRHAGKLDVPRKAVDLRFFGMMLEIAGDNRVQRAKALFYYSIVRAVGWLYWERNGI